MDNQFDGNVVMVRASLLNLHNPNNKRDWAVWRETGYACIDLALENLTSGEHRLVCDTMPHHSYNCGYWASDEGRGDVEWLYLYATNDLSELGLLLRQMEGAGVRFTDGASKNLATGKTETADEVLARVAAVMELARETWDDLPSRSGKQQSR